MGKLRGEQKVIMPITNSGYGIGEAGEYCTEEAPLKPITLYSRTKVEAESFVLERDNSISFRFGHSFWHGSPYAA